MALILRGATRCSICGTVLQEQEPVVATSHFIADQADPLWQFSDTAMHKGCFLDWHLRKQFLERFNATAGTIIFGNGHYHHMEDDGRISVLKNSDED